MLKLVTIDFHNTLFHCDDWFQLEIQGLPAAAMNEIFDNDALLADTELQMRARSAYLDLRAEAIRSGVECDAVTGVARVFDELRLNASRHQIEGAVTRIMQDALLRAHPLDGAVDLLRSVSTAGVPIAVVSSAAYHPFLLWCFDRFGMASSLSRVITSASCGIYKSDPSIYRYTVDLFDVSPAQAVHLGDSHRFDVTSASSIGMQTILLTDTGDEELVPAPDAVAANLGEAWQHLDRLLSK